ncbi:hypothetical protein C6P46_003642 [Rhodotorula mucilaginosa]|uniref:Uncharacterized protein n=1 Tax=Rhodotorula mucilaginosa TaxID=5537 RepID=A0A9P6W858_RHOMI|nr:hypothetical protein C6P46_003642 [Rhodotorula mucilaginosa]
MQAGVRTGMHSLERLTSLSGASLKVAAWHTRERLFAGAQCAYSDPQKRWNPASGLPAGIDSLSHGPTTRARPSPALWTADEHEVVEQLRTNTDNADHVGLQFAQRIAVAGQARCAHLTEAIRWRPTSRAAAGTLFASPQARVALDDTVPWQASSRRFAKRPPNERSLQTARMSAGLGRGTATVFSDPNALLPSTPPTTAVGTLPASSAPELGISYAMKRKSARTTWTLLSPQVCHSASGRRLGAATPPPSAP